MALARGGERPLRAFVRLTGQSAWQGALGFYESDDLTYAASIAYYALLSLFPCSLLGIAVLGAVTADEQDRSEVLAFVLRFFPHQFDFITGQLDAFRANTVSFGIVGGVGLVWGAVGVFAAITTAVNYAWGVEQPRGFWKHKLFSFLMLAVAGLVLLSALLLVSLGGLVGQSWFSQVSSHFPGLLLLRGLAVRYATVLLFIVVVGLVFYAVPNTRVRFRDVWVGAVITGLLWKGATELFGSYMSDLGRLAEINGSIAAVVAFLVWVYVQAVILLYGVEFTAAYARIRRRVFEEGAAEAPGA